MKDTTLKFPDMVSLRKFAAFLRQQSYEIHEARLILVCSCREEELDVALKEFKATVVEDFK